MLRVPGIADRRLRDHVVALVEVRLGQYMTTERSDSASDDVTRLVTWCTAHSGGIAALIEAVDAVAQQTGTADRLRAADQIGRQTEMLEPQERALVEDRIAQLDQAAFAAIVRDLATRWGPRLRAEARDPTELLRLLEDAIAGSGEQHPLFVFLSRLAELHDDAGEVISELATEVGQRTGMIEAAIADRADHAPDSGQQYFVVRLEEHGLQASRYLLTVWLATERGVWTLRHTHDEALLLEDVRAKVDEQLADLAADPTVDIDALTIEFILPRSLLNFPVDQWEVSAPGYSRPIGVHYPVVVRDLPRMRNRIIRSRWRRRCQWVHGPEATTPANAVRFINLRDDTSDLYAELMQEPHRPACVVVIGPSSSLVMERLGPWLTAGVPVIVWCRNDQRSSRFDAELAGILVSGGVKALPTSVYRLRQDAGGPDHPDDHVGMHITLVWDIETRVPPDEQRLRQPAQHST
ncbi:hypothetical protein GCM10017581_063960 [Dactylosporangium matsuzakiense]|uniref:Uncharacterized protein n=1 Tax=Dactylosporangium matsuzakiense TaxID=53360 RepID=A0A9W6NPM4_9ACTN|nr:hypothetical protein GCM10017581_063960 [Dactylosporangium matsuzakiense]